LLARGKIKASDYQETREIIDRVVADKRKALDELHEMLGIPDFDSPKSALFRLGPATTPLMKGLVALIFGTIPFVSFVILASWSENLLGEVSIFGLQVTAYRTLGVPWGPIYLFFFGYFFHVLWGNYGVIKGLVFSLVLISLNVLFEWPSVTVVQSDTIQSKTV
jgi:hypothetical protein